MENHKVFHSFPARCVLLYWVVFPDVSTIQGDFSQEIVFDWNGWVPGRDGAKVWFRWFDKRNQTKTKTTHMEDKQRRCVVW